MRNLQVELTISAFFIRASCVATSSSDGSSERKISPSHLKFSKSTPFVSAKFMKGVLDGSRWQGFPSERIRCSLTAFLIT